MSTKHITFAEAKEVIDTVNQCIGEGFRFGDGRHPSAVHEAGRRLGFSRTKVWARVRSASENHGLEPTAPTPDIAYSPEQDAPANPVEQLVNKVKAELLRNPRTLAEIISKTHADTGQVLDALDELIRMGVRVSRVGDRYDIPKVMPAAYMSGHKLELVSDKNNQFFFGALSDNHCGSKYERRDVLADLYDRFQAAGIKHVFHAGNWIDGACNFNRHDLLAHGIEAQCQLLAETYPQREGITTYAVAGDDHEGWFAAREGIDVGAYCENVMRQFGREDWVNLGYMEAYIPLINANSQKQSMMTLVHPGGGSSYATSYAIQKIVESLEGGEKPAVGLYGHYHKQWAGNIRNVWCLITACCQDQTPFMRKKKLEAHVGGALVKLEQDPESGAIIGFSPDMKRYFATGFYDQRWSHSGPINPVERRLGR